MTSEQKEIDYLKIFASVQQSILGQHIPTLTDKDTSGVKLSSLVVKSIESSAAILIIRILPSLPRHHR